MPSVDVDAYLADVTEPGRATLVQLRRNLRELLPEAEECIYYGVPAFKFHGKTVAGFAAFKNHLSYLPHSGSVLASLEPHLTDFEHTKGALHFPTDQPLPVALVRKLVTARLGEVEP